LETTLHTGYKSLTPVCKRSPILKEKLGKKEFLLLRKIRWVHQLRSQWPHFRGRYAIVASLISS